MYNFCLETPHGIGPHEGHELDLMLAGEKPCALFYDTEPGHQIIPDTLFAPYVASGHIKRVEVTFASPKLPEKYQYARYVYFCLAGEETRITRLHELHKKLYKGKWKEEYDIEVGRLLGYKEFYIKAYIHHARTYR